MNITDNACTYHLKLILLISYSRVTSWSVVISCRQVTVFMSNLAYIT